MRIVIKIRPLDWQNNRFSSFFMSQDLNVLDLYSSNCIRVNNEMKIVFKVWPLDWQNNKFSSFVYKCNESFAYSILDLYSCIAVFKGYKTGHMLNAVEGFSTPPDLNFMTVRQNMAILNHCETLYRQMWVSICLAHWV